MKKNSLIPVLALMLATTLALPSCKDDDDPKDSGTTPDTPVVELNLDENLVNKGIEVAYDAKSYSLPVTATGKWSAAIDADCDWAAIDDNDVEYDGNKTVVITIDPNYSAASRSTVIYISKDGDDEIMEVPVSQRGSDANSAQAFAGKGLGHGADYDYVLNTKENKKRRVLQDAKIANGEMEEKDKEKFDLTKIFKGNCVFNLDAIEKLVKDGKIEQNAYIEDPLEVSKLEVSLLDSCLTQDKKIAASIEVNVSLGFLEIQAKADYFGDKKENRTYVDYFIQRSAPMYHAYISEDVIKAYAEEASEAEFEDMEEKYAAIDQQILNYKIANARNPKNKGDSTLTKAQQKKIDAAYKKIEKPTYGGVFSVGFADKYFKLYEAVNNEKYATANQILAQLDDGYGPFYISGGNWGGSINMHMMVDNDDLEGETRVGASLGADIMSMVDIQGSVQYSDKGSTILHNMKLDLEIYGGNANEVADSVFSLLTSKNPNDYSKIQNFLKGWVSSMESNDFQTSKAMPISFTITPIWNLFTDEYTQEYARQYFILKYKDSGILTYLGIAAGNKVSVEDILNAAEFVDE